jgi:hypothetical protein
MLADSEVMSQWLRGFLRRYGPEQLALAPVQLAADAIRARAFQDTMDYVKHVRSRPQQQQQQRQHWRQKREQQEGEQQGSRRSRGSSSSSSDRPRPQQHQQQQLLRRGSALLEDVGEGYELLMPVKRASVGAWRGVVQGGASGKATGGGGMGGRTGGQGGPAGSRQQSAKVAKVVKAVAGGARGT